MKRKLSDRDVTEAKSSPNPTTSARPETTPITTSQTSTTPSFSTLSLDPRLLQSLTAQQFSTPTPIQATAIPLLLQGKDVLARARTGSGKTAAYALPLLHRILAQKATSKTEQQKLSGLILVPTRELAAQVTKAVIGFAQFCGKEIRTENVTRKEEEGVLRARLTGTVDVVVATPSRALGLVNAGVLELEGLVGCVIDEADLVLSYGHEEDLRALSEVLPKGTQMCLVSATLRKEVETLKGLFCKGAVVLEMEDKEEEGKLRQFVVKCGEDEKFLLVYAIFMLKLIKGKVIVFVADIDRCYRLKLFLEQFGIRSCVLNSELPANSRIHAVEEFNRNVYDIIIASDENEVVGSEERKSKKQKKAEAAAENEPEVVKVTTTTAEEEEPSKVDEDEGAAAEEPTTGELGDGLPKKKRKRNEQDAEYGISRGIDFKNVSCVLNFDLPLSSKSYTHRIGRTARAGKTGMALSFCVPSSLHRKHKPTSIAQCANDETVLAKITKTQDKRGQKIEPYDFDMKRLDGFRYRMADALRAVTGIAVREARTKEIRQELIKSEKLKRHFEENPEDLEALRHDKETHTVRTQNHLKHVPEYLLPGGAKSVVRGDVGFSKIGENRIRAARKRNAMKGKKKAGKKGGKDPLKSLGRK
ncbi:ATP-dependent RNA helicase dbp9 [Elsinoe australis]|uniref:RNA helicase n=1 Tax=Elsinoe australis TaxID=40998 RepID=A0A4U7BAT3_9PEZI|nr:ATP-dependent RNA helicase dbp9 [Elsinoe australis]